MVSAHRHAARRVLVGPRVFDGDQVGYPASDGTTVSSLYHLREVSFMVTMHNAKRMSRLAAVGGVTGALALGAFGLAVSAHDSTTKLSEPSTQTPAATATQAPGATATQTPGATATQVPGAPATSPSTSGAPAATGVPGVTSGGSSSGGTVPGAGDYVPGSGR